MDWPKVIDANLLEHQLRALLYFHKSIKSLKKTTLKRWNMAQNGQNRQNRLLLTGNMNSANLRTHDLVSIL